MTSMEPFRQRRRHYQNRSCNHRGICRLLLTYKVRVVQFVIR